MKHKGLIIVIAIFLALLAALLYDSGILYLFWETDQDRLQRKPVPELHEAVIAEDKEKVEQLIKEGADINELAAILGRGGRETPLCLAAHAGNREIVEMLIANGADVNKECPLRHAVRGNHREIAIILIDSGADVNRSRYGNIPLPLIAVAERGNIEMLNLLIDRGIDIPPDPDAPYSWDSPIHIAARRGHKEMVQMLLSCGVKVDTPKMDQTPLHSAAGGGSIEVAELLVAHGAQVNSKGENGVTALRNAAIGGHPEMVKWLIEHGAEINSKTTDDGWTPLHSAADSASGQSDADKAVVRLLIANGADLNAKDNQGRTPLDLARQRNLPQIAEILRKHAAKD